MTQSKIIKTASGAVLYEGPDATRLYAAVVLRQAISTYLKCGMLVSRMYTPKRMAEAAGQYTGKPYTSRHLARAVEDLHQWIVAAKANIPVETQS